MVAYSNLKGTRSPPARILPPSSPDVLALRRPATASWVLREAKQVAPTTRLAGRKSSKSRCAPPVRPLGTPSAAGAIGATRLFFFPPELLEPLGPAAVELVEPVPDRVLLVEVLVVLLGGIELRGRHDLGDDRPLERLGLHQRLLRFLGQPLLRLVVVGGGPAKLVPIVAEMPVRRGWINVVPEDLQELGVADLGGIEEDLDRLRVAGLPGRHVLVGRILLHAAGIAGRVETTPSTLSNASSMHQKHPPANVAFCSRRLSAPGVLSVAADTAPASRMVTRNNPIVMRLSMVSASCVLSL